MKIVILDYGLGNLGSIKNMFKKVGYQSLISNDPNEIENATHIVLPGVGAFDRGVKALIESDLIDILNKKALEDRAYILGICLGMQLLTNGSEEGQLDGLGWIDAYTRRFRFGNDKDHGKLKIPHMGWSEVHADESDPLFKGFDKTPEFYFVHSYHVDCSSPLNSIGTSIYGYEFTCSVRRENIFGVQFHPEKSHRYGMQLLRNFATIQDA